jgi:hypothetical protein
LLVTDPETELRRIEATNGGLLDDSFRWVLSNAEFQKWQSSSQSQLLWIKGDPGKGKTMLMIGIIKELAQQIQSQPSQSIAYFLCQATDPRLSNATSILRSLIYMLIQQQPHLISYLREKYETDPKLFESRNTFYSLSAIFEKMIQNFTHAMTYLLVDALDECETDLFDLLRLIARTILLSADKRRFGQYALTSLPNHCTCFSQTRHRLAMTEHASKPTVCTSATVPRASNLTP